MTNLLKEKSWYTKYVARIASEEPDNLKKKEALLAKFLSSKHHPNASDSDDSSSSFDEILRMTKAA
jgi:hypothetical protein